MGILDSIKYDEAFEGISIFSGEKVLVLGEQKVKLDDGRIVEQYLYDIVGFAPTNELPFVSLKANIILGKKLGVL